MLKDRAARMMPRAASPAGAISSSSDGRRGIASAHFVAAALFAAVALRTPAAQGQSMETPPSSGGQGPLLRQPPKLLGPDGLAPSANIQPRDRPPLIVADAAVDAMATMPAPASAQLLQVIASLVRENIPEHYQNDKDWNRTKKKYAGIKLRRDGWRIDTKRRWKEVRHGRWRRYRIDLINPDERLEVRLSDFRWLAENRFHVRLTIVADMDLFARQARWNYDVQLYSIHVDAHARIQMQVDTTVGFHFDHSVLPPALVVAPVVERAQLELQRFEVDRISHIHGDLAKELGNAAEGLIRREIIDRQSAKLAERMNHQIQRHSDDLRISVADWLTRWLARGAG